VCVYERERERARERRRERRLPSVYPLGASSVIVHLGGHRMPQAPIEVRALIAAHPTACPSHATAGQKEQGLIRPSATLCTPPFSHIPRHFHVRCSQEASGNAYDQGTTFGGFTSQRRC